MDEHDDPRADASDPEREWASRSADRDHTDGALRSDARRASGSPELPPGNRISGDTHVGAHPGAPGPVIHAERDSSRPDALVEGNRVSTGHELDLGAPRSPIGAPLTASAPVPHRSDHRTTPARPDEETS